MQYTKVSFKIDPDTELNRQLLIAKLGEFGFDSFTETEEQVEAFIPSKDFDEDLISQKFISEYQSFTYSYCIEKIPDQNWNEIWEKNYFKPLLINEECLIRAPFHTDFPKTKYQIIIDPQMAFGTGNHETTYLMISQILKLDFKGRSVLDMGCGTGVLGILASMKGAEAILAVDIDENAYQIAIENAKYNHISNMEVILGGADLLQEEKYDFIFANIQKNILLQDLPAYSKVMKSGAMLIMSGFYLNDLPAIQHKAESLGLQFHSFEEKNNWVAVSFILQ